MPAIIRAGASRHARAGACDRQRQADANAVRLCQLRSAVRGRNHQRQAARGLHDRARLGIALRLPSGVLSAQTPLLLSRATRTVALADVRDSSPCAIARSTAATKSESIRIRSSRDHTPISSDSIGARETSKLAPPFRCRDLPPRFWPGTAKFDMENARREWPVGREAA